MSNLVHASKLKEHDDNDDFQGTTGRAANLRLGPMINHRYQLHRPVETTGGRTKRSLDIAVFDANTAISRSTTSLSGGEGFQASLALALGLSDVVQQNSGGIKLDAIFIDEGFGTLDQETLDTALDTLCSLTGEMRAVGLISHIPNRSKI